MKGEHNRAIGDHTRAIKLDPNDASAYNGRAMTYFDWGKAAKGLSDANTAIQLKPDDANFYHSRGCIYEAFDRKDDAIADFRKALELDPSMEDSKTRLKHHGVTP